MKRKIARNIIGCIILACTVLLLFSLTFYNLLSQQLVLGIVMAVGIIGLLYGIFTEWNQSKRIARQESESSSPKKTDGTPTPTRKSLAKDARIVLSVCLASVITYALSVYVGLGSVVAAGFVGIAAGLLLPNYAAPIYCGAFVGMAGPLVLPLLPEVLLAGFVAGCIYVFAIDIFNGFGGKLGTIALGGCLTTILVTSNAPQTLSALSLDTGYIVMIGAIVSAVITYVFNVRVLRNPVLASALVGLAGGLVLPHLFPETGSILAAVVICASFAGMSSQKRAGNELTMAFIGIIVGFVFVYAYPYLGGCGGKLGTIAFGSVIVVRGIIDIYEAIKGRLIKNQSKTPVDNKRQ